MQLCVLQVLSQNPWILHSRSLPVIRHSGFMRPLQGKVLTLTEFGAAEGVGALALRLEYEVFHGAGPKVLQILQGETEKQR